MNKNQLKRIIKEEFLAVLKTAIKPRKKKSLNEHWLGELPSEKLMKMKWNPVTDPIQEDVYDSSDLKTPYPDRGEGDTFNDAEVLDLLKDRIEEWFRNLTQDAERIGDNTPQWNKHVVDKVNRMLGLLGADFDIEAATIDDDGNIAWLTSN